MSNAWKGDATVSGGQMKNGHILASGTQSYLCVSIAQIAQKWQQLQPSKTSGVGCRHIAL